MAKANKDGWIRHRGGKCPVEKGTLIDVRYRDGKIHEKREAGDWLCSDWTHTGSVADILAYRICQPEQQKAPEVKETAETLRARYLATFKEKKALEVTIAARQNEIAMIEKEQEELRGKVRALGFDFYDAPKVEEDMSDQNNWRVGDVIECIDSGVGEVGELATIREITKNTISKTRKSGGITDHVIGSAFWKFHSRPK